jgi:hypothetical protein
MSTPESIHALRRANPRNEAGFADSVETAAALVRHELAAGGGVHAARRSRRRLLGVSAAAAAVLAAAAVVAYSTIGSSGVQSASAAFEKATNVTAASAERSGTAVLRMSHDGRPWAGNTIQWNGADIAISSDMPGRDGRPGSALLVAGGILYGIEGGHWVSFGSPKGIDPDSGTTPDEYLDAVREDVGGATLRRILEGMDGLTTRQLANGSTVYSGAVVAGLVARETGFKEGHAIRVLPFGYVAHDDAADPAAPLDAAVRVGPGGIVRQIVVTWRRWAYTVTYSGLGSTAAPKAPENAEPLGKLRRLRELRR